MDKHGFEEIVKGEGSILSAINRLNTQYGFPSSLMQELHPFAEGYDDVQPVLPQLTNIVDITSLISVALLSHDSLQISDPKLISLLRQHAILTQELNMAEASARSRIKALRTRKGIDYGEEVPSNLVPIDEWFSAQLESWAQEAGMQVYTDRETENKITLILSGKILVLDIDIKVYHNPNIHLEMVSLKSTQAFPLDAAAATAPSLPTSGSFIDDFILKTFREYLVEIQKDSKDINVEHISKLCRSLKRDLHHLMKLDNLAQRIQEGGSRWFTEVDDLSSVAKQLAPKEAVTVARDLQVSHAPLDILLTRGHALPFPYLHMLAPSFLVYVSPLCYLALLRSSKDAPNNSNIDVPLDVLESYLRKKSLPKGCVLADLCMQRSSQPPCTAEMFGGPKFPLVPLEENPEETDFDHILPIDNGPDAWVVDFGPEGVVMSQSRMWEIQVLLKRTPAAHGLPIMAFAYSGSWVDLLIQKPDELIPHEAYIGVYTSPTQSHPPLQLRLTVPQEPGFILRKIRVQSMHQAWAIFEIVRDQAWYNSLIYSCEWRPADPETLEIDSNPSSNSTTLPKYIPVAIYFEPLIPPPLFESSLHREHPSVFMIFPRNAPGMPVENASIKLDSSASRGVKVTVNGYPDIKALEEFVRRGGAFGLPGKLWKDTW
ncbi:hypothetical protein Clacol_000493 [Clathrus columnatus]|uniref:Mediator of RNA polymerase II transcription subunit 1 n=1 Tax=Clathrus columnatus TaxID=1419009 RepID=A0AAV4ZWR8_9AGAM|nr:hypothetical protein Clacol_000493 [Clathrus columnatus]